MMVSTRGVKLKFIEGERVLCYEPDPTKAKVLYDSKVLDIIVNKDHRGRKIVEYLIHFQGWNSSWDRCVGEEYVLKDTPENRQLQKDLAEKSQLQLGAYLYRRERKKHGRKTSERVAASSEDGSCGSPALMDDDDSQRHLSSSDEDSSADEDSVLIELTRDLRDRLEHDHFVVNTKQKLHKLPADPNVVNILELYWRHYVSNQICCLNEKPTRYRQYSTYPKIRPEDVQTNLNLCREVLDGIRIYFDFTLHDLLLYKLEQGQFQTAHANFLPSETFINKDENSSPKSETHHDYTHLPITEDEEAFSNENSHHGVSSRPITRRRTLRSHRSIDVYSNGTHMDNSHVKTVQGNTNNSTEVQTIITKIPTWKALPEHIYSQHLLPPCLVYGATHLTRLFVKLPELLNNTNMEEEKLKVLQRHIDSFIDFLTDRKEWFGDRCYVESKQETLE